MRCKKSEEPIVTIMAKPMRQRTCVDGCRGRLCQGKTQPSKGSSSLDRVEVNSTITPVRSKEDTRTVSTAEMAIKRSLVTVCEYVKIVEQLLGTETDGDSK